jgi:hypothetical protein
MATGVVSIVIGQEWTCYRGGVGGGNPRCERWPSTLRHRHPLTDPANFPHQPSLLRSTHVVGSPRQVLRADVLTEVLQVQRLHAGLARNEAGHKPTGGSWPVWCSIEAVSFGRGCYAFRRRKYINPIAAIPANRARLPGSGTDSSFTPSPQWAARMAASLTFLSLLKSPCAQVPT